jgi:hypothetical protein
MQSIVRTRPARGRRRRPAVHSRRRSKIFWLNAVALCLMSSGVVLAFAGRQAFHWAPLNYMALRQPGPPRMPRRAPRMACSALPCL